MSLSYRQEPLRRIEAGLCRSEPDLGADREPRRVPRGDLRSGSADPQTALRALGSTAGWSEVSRPRTALSSKPVDHEHVMTATASQAGAAVGPPVRRGHRRARSRAGSARGVIQHDGFAVEPWAVRETSLDLERLAQTESVFALANGHLGLRANLAEGEPFGQPGTYLAGFYETRPLPYAEPGYGDPEDGQTVVNVTNGKIIRLAVEDEPFDVRYGELRRHERVLDLRAGVLRRTAEWVSPTGRLVRVSSTRVVSFTQRSIAAVLYEVEPLEDQVQVVLQCRSPKRTRGRQRRWLRRWRPTSSPARSWARC